MKRISTLCPWGISEDTVLAAAMDEADPVQQHAMAMHAQQCPVCARLFTRYQDLQHVLSGLHDSRVFDIPVQQAVQKLLPRLQGQPQVLCYHYFPSALGTLTLARSTRGVLLVAWPAKAAQWLATRITQEDHHALHTLEADLAGYFAGTRTQFDWPVDDSFITSSFQRDVLNITATIPYGAVMSYRSLAAALGQPGAVRAVAQALHRNPLAIVIPCHRVVGLHGHLTGYAGGLDTKQALLAHEGIPLQKRRDGMFIDQTRMFVGWRSSRYYCRPQCPSLSDLSAGDAWLLSPRAVTAQPDWLPCDVCNPEVAAM